MKDINFIPPSDIQIFPKANTSRSRSIIIIMRVSLLIAAATGALALPRPGGEVQPQPMQKRSPYKDTDKEVADLPPLLGEASKHVDKVVGALPLLGGRSPEPDSGRELSKHGYYTDTDRLVEKKKRSPYKDTDKQVADLPPLLGEASKHVDKVVGALPLSRLDYVKHDQLTEKRSPYKDTDKEVADLPPLLDLPLLDETVKHADEIVAALPLVGTRGTGRELSGEGYHTQVVGAAQGRKRSPYRDTDKIVAGLPLGLVSDILGEDED
ncbi:hypothetical protein VFPFJ_11219 [Purpureocillium lilacinum]|uniref:Uncharacterized protein n=1 Tax=Purpureocillium lilacinum TaxID=33203 RepID=A0A179FJJ0_PURLI|nr:hypothetical protein VFPFJ_11219 [Purpureocillium lilacinum]OAQ65684.1 hypothetical protein VFPFJ_11219 [Purpureocillium lilacinum]